MSFIKRKKKHEIVEWKKEFSLKIIKIKMILLYLKQT